jgi:hypothetical protein
MQPSTVNANNIIQTLLYNGSAQGGGWSVSYAAPNASSVMKEYARTGGSVQVNTAGAEGGAYIVATIQGGTLTEVFRANQLGQVAAAAGSALAPVYTYQSEISLGLYRSGVSTVALSYGTLNLATQGVRLSMRTIAASALTASAANTNVAVNETVFTVSASGASFAINSGGTTWIFNSDASAKNT